MSENTKIWDILGRTDPAHTKAFSRSGGFKGTAIKPIWSFRRMTEEFGPCGVGWGVGEPVFQVVPAGEEILVYCTAKVWFKHEDNHSQHIYGVGGDKVVGKNKYGLNTDDEAFKKAFTDAVTNALKLIGVGADIHMGLWDGNKYIDEKPEAANEAPQEQPKAPQKYDRNPIVKAEFERITKGIREAAALGTMEDLKFFWTANSKTISGMPADWKVLLEETKEEAKVTLEQRAA
jgi:hypothetical protein